jgi:conjugal transfer pilus assembly protein TraB
MKEKLVKMWETLKPEQRKKSIIASVLIVLTVVAFGIYKSTRGSAPPPPPSAKREINLGAGDRDVLEKSLYNESTKVIDDMKSQMEDLQKQLKAVQEAKETPETPSLPLPNAGSGKGLSGLMAKDKGRLPVPEPPMPVPSSTTPPLPPGVPPSPVQQPGMRASLPGAVAAPPKPEVYGGIKVVSQTEGDAKNDAKKKDGMKIYLPPSFMEGTLLSGMYAPANSGGKGEPLPGLIRIKNLAILPNSVKADLKGCFVIVEAQGSLFDERAHVRLDTLSCLAKNGESVIDQRVKGYVVDQDGFVGLRGTVVSKMGAAVARSLFAGFVAGFGDAVAQSTTITSISPLGTTQTFNTDEAAKAGVGKGLSQAGHDLQRFLLDLGKQAIPAIEVGAMRPVTVVISEGVDLEIKEKKNGCLNGDAACASPVF